jgi:hypothetical protein
MAFNHKYNTDDSIIRANIVGLVNEMNNKIRFDNVWSDAKKKEVRVPWFYAMSGDERFLQDYFSNWNDCAPDFIEGNTDPIPRGSIWMSGYSVLSSNLTSRYVRGYYTKEVEGELKRFNSYINSIPIQMNFTAEILVDSSIDSFKIAQAVTEFFYRTQTFSVNFKGFRVPTQVGFPDSYTSTKQFEFTYGVTERSKVTFDIELQSFLPIVDGKEEFFAGNRITHIISSVDPNTELGDLTPLQIDVTPDYVPTGITGSTNITNPVQTADTEVGGGGGSIGKQLPPTDIKYDGKHWIGPE